jgi:CRISPR-associated protein Csd1
MILQELVRYYDRQRNQRDSDIAPPGWIRRPVDYVVVLQADGDCIDLQQRYTVEKGKRVGPPELLPAIGKQSLKHTNSGKDANLLWDNASFVLGVGDRGSLKLGSFIQTIDRWFSQLSDPGIAAVRAFLVSLQQQPSKALELIERFGARADFDERDPVLTFRLMSDGPVTVHERKGVRQAYAERANAALANAVRGRCLVTGADNVPLATNETVIKGVWNAQPAGANLVAFNAAAFVSYGKQGRNAENAPIGLTASSAYSTSLNHLLASSRHRVQVGDASTVFWADGPSRFDGEFTLADFFGESKDDPGRGVRAVQALFEALKTGKLPVGERDVEFFVLGLAPNAARISVRFWLRAPLAALAPRIAQHFKDIELIRRYDSDPIAPSLVRMLKSLCFQEDTKHLPPRLAGEWMRAILEGLPYPATLLSAAMSRCKAEQASRDQGGNRKDNVPYIRTAAIKAWLNRWIRIHQPDRKEFTVALDPDNIDAAYRLGRLFAACERIQADAADRELNRTIRDAYFGSAMATPASVFPRLMKLNQHHMRDLRRHNPGLHTIRDRLLIEITGGIDAKTSFPSTMTLPDQGRFALGYYHQRQAFFTRKVSADTTTTPEE